MSDDSNVLIHKFARRFLIWSAVCFISAVPSLVFALGFVQANNVAIFLALLLFTIAQTAVSCTPIVERIYRRPFVEQSVRLAYLLRIFISVVFPIGMFVDIFPGLISTSFVESLGFPIKTFAGSFLTTIVQGILINTILFLFMGLVQALQLMFRDLPPEESRGFEVVMPATQDKGDAHG